MKTIFLLALLLVLVVLWAIVTLGPISVPTTGPHSVPVPTDMGSVMASRNRCPDASVHAPRGSSTSHCSSWMPGCAGLFKMWPHMCHLPSAKSETYSHTSSDGGAPCLVPMPTQTSFMLRSRVAPPRTRATSYENRCALAFSLTVVLPEEVELSATAVSSVPVKAVPSSGAGSSVRGSKVAGLADHAVTLPMSATMTVLWMDWSALSVTLASFTRQSGGKVIVVELSQAPALRSSPTSDALSENLSILPASAGEAAGSASRTSSATAQTALRLSGLRSLCRCMVSHPKLAGRLL